MDTSSIIMMIKAARDIGLDPMSYSGRGMYGKNCLGIAVSREKNIFNLCASICSEAYSSLNEEQYQDFIEELCDLTPCQDSLGTGSIIYFPSIPWVEKVEESKEDEEDNMLNENTDLEG